MQGIETDWQSNRLVVHARGAHVGMAADDLRACLGDCSADGLLVAAAEATVREGMAALSFSASEAVDFLLSFDDAQELSPSMRLWRWLAQFVMDRIAAGQFYPTVETGDDAILGVWRLLVTGDEELQWLARIAKEASTASTQQDGSGEQLVESFLNAATDALIRRAFAEDSFFATAAARCHAAGAGPDARFLGSLLTEQRRVPGMEPFAYEQIRSWVDVLQDRPMAASFRLALRLRDPFDDEPLWTVEILMQPLHGDVEPISASRLWDMGEELPPILGRSLTAQRDSLLSQLQSAAEIWPVLQLRIEEQPGTLTISAAEAIALARQWAPRLAEAGISVDLPRWARDPARELMIQLDVHPANDNDDRDDDEDGENPRRSGNTASSGPDHAGLGSILQFDWRVAVGSIQLSEEQFASILKSGEPLVQFNGEWLQVDTDAARQAMEFMAANSAGDMTLADALRTAHGTSRAQTGLQISGLSGTGWIGQLLQQSPDAQLQSMPQPAAFLGELRPYQLRGLQWLAFLQRLGIGACLADDMGLGKTIQFIALMLYEREVAARDNLPKVGPTLLFAPTSVMGNWRNEMERFAPSMRLMVHHGVQRLHGETFRDNANACDLVITTYALSSRDMEDFRLVKWHRMALDEAQKIKNPSAASTQAIRSIPAGFRVALTGTPIENHLSELWSIMDILNPGLLGTAAMFREQFAVPIERIGEASRAGHLRELIKPFVLRRSKSDPIIAGDLPEKVEMKVYCNLTVEQASLYQRITDEMLGQIDVASGIRRRGLILAALTRLKQICDHPVMLNGKIAGYDARPSELDNRSGKCERLLEMMEEVLDEGDSALIFTQYKEMGDILEQVLTRRLNRPVLYLHGGTPATKRDSMIKQFQDPNGGVNIFLLSLRAGGLGLNLTRANHVFHFDRWWNPAVEQQATDRAHRIGQTRTVQVHKYVCIGTMEERIDRMISDKMQLADRIISSGDEWLTGLSTEDLRRTLQLTADAIDDTTGAA